MEETTSSSPDEVLSLDKVKARVGEELYRATSPVVTTTDIRKYAMAVYWPETPPRLFWDEEHAKHTRWRGIVAPEDFNAFAWPIAGPGRFPKGLVPAGPRRFNAASDARYHVPIRPGDVLQATETVLEPYERTGRSGRMLFIVTETRWTNQRGELVKTQRGEEVEILQETTAAEALPRPGGEGDGGYPLHPAAHGPIARFEDIELRQEIPAFQRTTDLQHWNRFAAVNDEFEYVHMDAESAKARGDKDAFAMGHLRFSYLHDLLRSWIGDSGIIRRVACQYRGIQYKGDTVTCRGVVARKYVKEGERSVDLELRVENQRGEILSRGEATVALPSRGEPSSLHP